MATGPDLAPFVVAFSEWVEACWFSEQDAADRCLEGPDPQREHLIGDVVRGANASPPVRAAILERHGSEAVTGAALECASVLAQAMAERDGVIPSSILLEY
jgi:hypothetical protein